MDALEKYIMDHQEELRKVTGAPHLPHSVWERVAGKLSEDIVVVALTKEEGKKPLPSELWNKIESRLEEEERQERIHEVVKPRAEKVVPMRSLWQMAAAFALILFSALFLQHYWMSSDASASLSSVDGNVAGQQIHPELAEAESYYMAVIQKQKASLQRYSPKSGQLKAQGLDLEQFTQDLEHLDIAYQQLKEDFEASQQHEQVRQAMVNNLQMRMNLLKQQLKLLESLEKGEKPVLDAEA